MTHKYVKIDVKIGVLNSVKDCEFLEFFRELLYIIFVINQK